MKSVPEMAAISRRNRLIYVPEDYVLKLLFRGSQVPTPIGIPKTARCVGVWSDYKRNSFAIVLQDDSFEDVAIGLPIPEMEITWLWEEDAVNG